MTEKEEDNSKIVKFWVRTILILIISLALSNHVWKGFGVISAITICVIISKTHDETTNYWTGLK
jgi:hypothetical protein